MEADQSEEDQVQKNQVDTPEEREEPAPPGQKSSPGKQPEEK